LEGGRADGSDDDDGGLGFTEAANFALGDGAAADHHDAAFTHVE
jgi:hypothetical protein